MFPRPRHSDGFTEQETGIIKQDFRSVILEKVAEYLVYKERWTVGLAPGEKVEDMPDFHQRLPGDIALEM